MRRAATLSCLAILVSLGALPARAELGATGTRLSIASGTPRFYMTYGHMDEGEVFAPIVLELKRFQVTFAVEGDTCAVLHKGVKVATWRVIRSREDIPESPDQPLVLQLGGSMFVPVKQLSKLLPIDIDWDKRNNLLSLVAGKAKSRQVAAKPTPAPIGKPTAKPAPTVAPEPTTKPRPVVTAPVAKPGANPRVAKIVRRGDASPVAKPELTVPAPSAPIKAPVPPAPAGPTQTATLPLEVVPDPAATGSIELSGVALEQEGAKLLVRVQASETVRPSVLYLKAPTRIVLDFADARWTQGIPLPEGTGPVRSARVGHPVSGQARLVLEVTSPAVKVAGIEVNGGEVRASLGGGLLVGKGAASGGTLAKVREALGLRNQQASKQRVASVPGSRGGNLFRSAPVTGEPLLDFTSLPQERNAWQYIVVHHSASPTGNATVFDRLHRGKGWDGLAYHFVITNGNGGLDGGLEISPRWSTQKHGAHAGALPAATRADFRNGFNEFGIGICLVGNFERQQPTERQLETLARLIQELRTQFDIPADHILGHATVKGTACPGGDFPWRKLFAMMDLPAPRHLHRHPANLTTARCPWCQEQLQEK